MIQDQEEFRDQEEYRDHLSTLDASGRRVWIYPKKPKGWYTDMRTYVSWILLAILFGLPFIKYNGEPLVLFNVIERHFIVFGINFTPQDMHLAALAMITLMLFIVLFTVVFGRLFCGWVCPQTIFMEMVFRKIEYWIEGDYTRQIKLNKAPWTAEKWIKKIGKHAIFFTIAVVIANTFLSYIIGVDEVMKIISEPVSMHMGGFIAMLIFSGLFYYIFAFFREQVCTNVCPYGRLQGVLLVKDSIVVAYDWIRGEPRGKKRRKEADNMPQLGDCIDCHLCVKVCPTGIDIRNGTQLECVNCTACMDACDEVMLKIGRDPGLIRYDSLTGIEKGIRKIFTPRVWAYSAVLLVLILFQSFLLVNRSDVETLILRTPGMLFQTEEDGRISNLYNYQIINKTRENYTDLSFGLVDQNGEIQTVGDVPDLKANEVLEGAFFIKIPKDELEGRKTRLKIHVFQGDDLLDEAKTTFLGPNQ
ncbi:MAG: cytochrome c oxidase accessory protein CcoG [Saprospiraceae bacterium]|nr:cytochrome c oxidase accessory protein CcoG [Saprospiraceae bacterium]